MHRPSAMAVLVTAGAILLSSAAFGQTTTGSAEGAEQPSAADREAAAAAFDQGMALFENENWAGALAAFQRAYELAPHYVVLYNIGQCHRFLGEYPEAIAALERYLQEGGERVAPQKRAEVAASLMELRSFVATVTVDIEGDGAEVFVDGESRGRDPLPGPLALGAGDHVIAAVSAAGARAERRVRLAGGETRTVELRFGEESATTTAGSEPPPTPTPTEGEGEGLAQVWFWTTAGVAGALAIGGAITGGLVLSKGSDYDDATTRCAAGDPRACADGPRIKSDGEDLSLVTNILLPAAGVAAAAAIALAFFTDFGDEEAAPDAAFEPHVAAFADGSTLGLSASFAF